MLKVSLYFVVLLFVSTMAMGQATLLDKPLGDVAREQRAKKPRVIGNAPPSAVNTSYDSEVSNTAEESANPAATDQPVANKGDAVTTSKGAGSNRAREEATRSAVFDNSVNSKTDPLI